MRMKLKKKYNSINYIKKKKIIIKIIEIKSKK